MKQGILALVLLTLSSFSFYSDASPCSTGSCPDNDSHLSGSQSQSDYNTLEQSPVLSMSGSNSNSIINANSVASSSVSMSADGGINLSGTCATNHLVMGVYGGQNNQSMARSGYSSTSNNIGGQVSVVIPWGEAQNNCLEGEEVKLRVAKIAATKMTLNTCFEFMRQGMSLQVLANILPEFSVCTQVAAEAEKNYHGQIGRAAIEAYKKNMIAQGIDPYKTFAK